MKQADPGQLGKASQSRSTFLICNCSINIFSCKHESRWSDPARHFNPTGSSRLNTISKTTKYSQFKWII